MKILVVSDRIAPLHAGGAARVAAALTHEYRRAGHDVVVVHADPTGAPPHHGEINGLRARWVKAPIGERRRAWLSVRNPRALQAFARIVAEEKPNVVHAHNLHEAFSFAALDVLHEASVPIVLTLHDCMAFHQGKFVEIARRPRWQTDDAALRVSTWDLLRRFRFRFAPGRRRRIRAIIERADARVVALSHLHRRVLNANGVPCYAVIHNGVRPDEFQADRGAVERFRARLGLVGRPVVATFGRLTGAKGRAQLLAAIRLVRSALPDAVLLTVGTPADEPGLVGTPLLSGDELAAAYGAADVIAAPSICLDVFLIVALEAMAAARPVVVSCFAGASEIIEHGRTGLVVNPLDVEALADALLELLRDKGKAAQMGQAARKLVEDGFTIQQCAARYLALLDELARSRRS